MMGKEEEDGSVVGTRRKLHCSSHDVTASFFLVSATPGLV